MLDLLIYLADKYNLPVWLTGVLAISAIILFAFGSAVVGIVVSWYRYRNRLAYNQLLFGVHYPQQFGLEQMTLALRTIFERPLTEAISDKHLARKIAALCKALPKDKPVVRFVDDADQRAMLKAVVNLVSPIMAPLYFLEMLGVPMRRFRIDFAVTCEKWGGEIWTKPRVLAWKHGTLDDRSFEGPFVFSTPSHRDRSEKTIPALLKEWNNGDPFTFGNFEIPIPEFFFVK